MNALPRARRLKAIAEWINANLPGYHAELERVTVNTDRPKPKGLRYRVHTGMGRTGNLLKVWKDTPPAERLRTRPHFCHNAAETYRDNSEVERWLAREVKELQVAAGARDAPGTGVKRPLVGETA